MVKTKDEIFEDPDVGKTSDTGANEEGNPKESYVDPSVEQVEAEEVPEGQQNVTLGLHPYGVQIEVVGRDGSRAAATVTPEEANNLAGNLLGLTGFHMQMSIQAQMQQQAQIREMMARGGQPQENRTKSGIIVK